MANLNGILKLVADGLLNVEQGELLVTKFFDNHNTRPEWLYKSEEAEIISLFKTDGKLHAIKQLKALATMRGRDVNIYGLKWCKEYVESITANL